MLNRFRTFWGNLLTPIARALLRAGVTPDLVTLVGTVGVCVGALAFFPRGELGLGVLFIAVFVFSDLLDGTMARLSGSSSSWGAFLDSTLDRFGDAAIFAGLVLWFAGDGDSRGQAALALYCLVMGAVTSYVRARAESLGLTASGGVAERADRLVLILAAAAFSDWFGLPLLLTLALALLALASTVTVGQRVLGVRAQTRQVG